MLKHFKENTHFTIFTVKNIVHILHFHKPKTQTMILASACFHFIGLFTLELIALTGALFLFVYLKTRTPLLSKWFSFAAAAILGLVVLIMAGTFIGAICMHAHGERRGHGEREGEERRMMFHHEFGGGMGMPGGHYRGMMRMEGECGEGKCEGMEGREGMGGCEEMRSCDMKGGEGMKGCDMKGCEGKDMKDCDMPCCKDKKGGHCDMDGMKGKTVIIKKDTLIGKKPAKK